MPQSSFMEKPLTACPSGHSEQREESRVVVLLFLLPLLFFELDPSVALLPQDDERAVSCVILNNHR